MLFGVLLHLLRSLTYPHTSPGGQNGTGKTREVSRYSSAVVCVGWVRHCWSRPVCGVSAAVADEPLPAATNTHIHTSCARISTMSDWDATVVIGKNTRGGAGGGAGGRQGPTAIERGKAVGAITENDRKGEWRVQAG